MSSGNNNIIFSDRIKLIASFVEPGLKVVDVGTDHGYVPIYLAKNNISHNILAMDVREQPLKKAEKNIKEAGYEDIIRVRLSDGVKNLEPGEADVAIMTGMGTNTIIDIFNDSMDKIKALKYCIISTQSMVKEFRRFLHDNSFSITDEKMVKDNKFYTVMRVEYKKDNNTYTDMEYKYGKVLIDKKDKVLLDFLKKESGDMDKIIDKIGEDSGENGDKRRQDLLKKKEELEAILIRMR